MKRSGITAIIISVLMLLPVLSGCNTGPDETTAAEGTDTSAGTSGAPETEPEGVQYMIPDEDLTSR